MSHVDDGFRSLTLKRFPQTDDVNPLLAWEAAVVSAATVG